MRRRTVLASAALAAALLAPAPVHAATPALTVSPAVGAAPLAVTLAASGSASGSYHWDLGDGTFAEGAVVQHTYAAGQWTATVSSDGESATAVVRAEGVSLSAPARGRFGAPAVLVGAVVPAAAAVTVTLESPGRALAATATAADGTFSFRLPRLARPGPYVARTALAVSAPATVLVRPRVGASFAGTAIAGDRIALVATAEPRAAGTLRVRLWRGARLVAETRGSGTVRIALRPGREGSLRAEAAVVPAAGYLAARAEARTVVLAPSLAPGARGPSVRVLEQRLAAMHYALRGVDGVYGDDTAEAVLAFQKVHGLARSGRVDRALWPRILRGTTPPARSPHGDHVEVDKTRQVLFEVRNGRVVLVVHVSTGATGNTPAGTWHVYRRVAGFDWVLYYPTYFLRGFAIHGYPEVPAYPASHGCVRVPMWVAQRLYAMDAYGDAVIVYP